MYHYDGGIDAAQFCSIGVLYIFVSRNDAVDFKAE
jgi:hypothetical protein